MEIDLRRLFVARLEQTDAHCEEMDATIPQPRSSRHQSEGLNPVFRMVDDRNLFDASYQIDQIVRFIHVLEDLLDRMQDGEILPTKDLCELLRLSTDVLSRLIQPDPTQPVQSGEVDFLLEKLCETACVTRSTNPGRTPASAEQSSLSRTYQIRFRPSATFFHSGQNPLSLRDELQKLGTTAETHADLSALPSLSDMDPEVSYVAWDIILQTSGPEHALQDVFMLVDSDSTPTIRRRDRMIMSDPFDSFQEGFATE